MKIRILMTAATAAILLASTSACSSLGQQNSADLLKQLDTNFANCDRHITFQAGVGVVTPGAQVSGSVDCKGGQAVSPSGALMIPSSPSTNVLPLFAPSGSSVPVGSTAH